MNTIVIHPEDSSTDFLKPIYADKNWFVVKEDFLGFTALLQRAERIVMLGHGSPDGLFGTGKFIIGHNHARFLKGKDCVAIWCHANQFMDKHKLSGFCTGMFISEPIEAEIHGIVATEDQIKHSNDLFARVVAKNISEKDHRDKFISTWYRLISGEECNPVINYNQLRLYEKIWH